MPKAALVTDEASRLIQERLTELEDERKRLERAVAHLDGRTTNRRSSTARADKTAPKQNRARRRRRSGRSDQVQKFVAANPGATTPMIAKSLKTKPANLYAVLGKLAKEGTVQKKGRQYFPPT
jgi:hypothetical protein